MTSESGQNEDNTAHARLECLKLFLFDSFLALLGTLVISSCIPWSAVLTTSLPTGGDNPAHPVLMHSIGEAFFSHLCLVHYSYSFWGGFEAFQFYFPLPYLFGAALSFLINFNVAYKLITILGVLALPPALYIFARCLRLSRLSATIGSLLAVNFLATHAHVMWGGNIYSTLAGMIGNSWAIVFLVLTIGLLCKVRLDGHFRIAAVLAFVATALCHFYGALTLSVLFLVFFIEDIILIITTRQLRWRSYFALYGCGAFGALLMTWWVVPLFYYQKFSTDFGGNWIVDLLGTLTGKEQGFFGVTLLFAIGFLIYNLTRGTPEGDVRSTSLRWIFSMGAVFLLLFFLSPYFNSTALVNIRLWPSIYLSLHLIAIITFDKVASLLPEIVRPALVLLLIFIVPEERLFTEARGWMEWNFSGITAKEGAADFNGVVAKLKGLPAGRVSFESSDVNNGTLGSIRMLEILPLLTPHEIVEGGIVNSSTFPGIGYSLQCLTSSSCAGWPPGSSMPAKDFPRAVETMRALGITYHVAQKKENREGLLATGAFNLLFDGPLLTLLELKRSSPLVEVYNTPLPVIHSERPHALLLNLSRWDVLRDKAVIFDSALAPMQDTNRVRVDPVHLFNFLSSEWYAGRHGVDLGWPKRDYNTAPFYLNSFFFSWRKPFVLEDALDHDLSLLISDRSFSPELIVSNMQKRGSEAAVPLIRESEGSTKISVAGRGYTVFAGEQQLPLDTVSTITFKKQNVRGVEAPFVLLHFKQIPGEPYQDIDLSTQDKTVHAGLPGEAQITLPERITDQCAASLTKEFHKLTLKTKCPGKPHLIKYSYYPKWHAEVPVYMASNGYMTLTPKETTTVIEHKSGLVDILAQLVSWCAVLGLLAVVAVRRRGRALPPI